MKLGNSRKKTINNDGVFTSEDMVTNCKIFGKFDFLSSNFVHPNEKNKDGVNTAEDIVSSYKYYSIFP